VAFCTGWTVLQQYRISTLLAFIAFWLIFHVPWLFILVAPSREELVFQAAMITVVVPVSIFVGGLLASDPKRDGPPPSDVSWSTP
jgi:hypothetical protein